MLYTRWLSVWIKIIWNLRNWNPCQWIGSLGCFLPLFFTRSLGALISCSSSSGRFCILNSCLGSLQWVHSKSLQKALVVHVYMVSDKRQKELVSLSMCWNVSLNVLECAVGSLAHRDTHSETSIQDWSGTDLNRQEVGVHHINMLI